MGLAVETEDRAAERHRGVGEIPSDSTVLETGSDWRKKQTDEKKRSS